MSRFVVDVSVVVQLLITDNNAEKLNYALITVDQRQARAALAEGIPLKDIADFSS